ncbi:hypothetical protein EW145_g4239 [Phellinidium pouzarii]|uniref:JmjC domain-containing protein n=1 Tax=Phellinidium pouzarii TaxID=167371 RepID=A0A4S4L4R2_9AGAM|nr:hypothetical protein EW145_g4239 [Phellinidium pouzarii]
MDHDRSLRDHAHAVLKKISFEFNLHLQLFDTVCGHDNSAKLLSAICVLDYETSLAELYTLAHEKMAENRLDDWLSMIWRTYSTYVTLVWSMRDCLLIEQSAADESFWKGVVARLDYAIIVAGAPGEGNLDMILESIELLQKTHLTLREPPDNFHQPSVPQKYEPLEKEAIALRSSSRSIPCLERAPSMFALRKTLRNAPFIVRGFANDWPAVAEQRWASKLYLQRVAGRGRVVPIEVGNDYRTDDWTQRIMDWEEFLDYLFYDTDTDDHDLFKQFPALRTDIVVPDYVYSALPPPEQYPRYQPPKNVDALVLNTWLGPRGTVSPAHTDPYYNFYVQVVGQKTVWLAPPHVSHALSPLHNHEGDRSNTVLGNTSCFDVFVNPDLDSYPESFSSSASFKEDVVPEAMSATLDAGDMLFFPPGWWHAMRSESVSFSVSMWF